VAVELVPDVTNAVIGIVIMVGSGSVVMVLLAVRILSMVLVLWFMLVLCAIANREKEWKTLMITIVYEYA
jgi:hypothetical protein